VKFSLKIFKKYESLSLIRNKVLIVTLIFFSNYIILYYIYYIKITFKIKKY